MQATNIIIRRVGKVATSDYFHRPIRLSVCMEKLGSHWTDFDETWYLRFFPKAVEKIQVLLESDKNNRYFTWRRSDIFDDISLNSS